MFENLQDQIWHTNRRIPPTKSAIADATTISLPFDDTVNPWEEARRQPNLPEDVLACTIHSIEWLSVFIDEGHKFRSQPWVASHFKRHSSLFIIATATPLYTRPMDLVNLAYILGIKSICCEDFRTSYRTLDASCGRTKRHLSRVSKLELPGVLDAEERDAALREHSEEVEGAMKAVAQASMEMVLMVKDRFGDRIIRRTTESLNYVGQPISMLPPYTMVMAYIKLRQEEMDVLWSISNNETKTCVIGIWTEAWC